MSRAFVKEGDGAEGEELAELKLSPHRNLVTAEGLAQIEAAVQRLREERSAARAAADRAAGRRIERDLRYWAARQRSAELVPPPMPGGAARFGSRVLLAKADGPEIEYRIVGEDEADPSNRKISYVAPIARALIGRREGDDVALPDGAYRLLRVG